MLSQNRVGGVGRWTPSSWSKNCSQVISAAVFAKDLYSDSVFEREIVGCCGDYALNLNNLTSMIDIQVSNEYKLLFTN